MTYSDLLQKFFLVVDKLTNDSTNEEKNTIKGNLLDALFLNYISLLGEESNIKESLKQSQLAEKELENKILEFEKLIKSNTDKYLPILSKAAKITLTDFVDQQKFQLNEIKRNEFYKIIEETLS